MKQTNFIDNYGAILLIVGMLIVGAVVLLLMSSIGIDNARTCPPERDGFVLTGVFATVDGSGYRCVYGEGAGGE